MASEIHAAKDRLTHDLKNVVHDTELLLREVGGELSEKGKLARARLNATLESAKETCHELGEKTAAAAKAADEYVHQNPYRSIGVAFGVGLLIGVLVARR
ncbi:MAG TPA: DUF883 domain-containing protein [Methylomirabilota bacterium]|nr:DUF883 domain-containing protein [Methylomirabilota bacterium]